MAHHQCLLFRPEMKAKSASVRLFLSKRAKQHADKSSPEFNTASCFRLVEMGCHSAPLFLLERLSEYSSKSLKWATEIGRDYANKMIMSPRIACSWKDFVLYLVFNLILSQFYVNEFVEN